jgi:hypothetical protein
VTIYVAIALTVCVAARHQNGDEQCLKSVDRLGKGRTFPGDRMKVPSKTGAVTLVGKV